LIGLEESFQHHWSKIAQDITEATNIVIPRQYFPSSQFSVQELHVFADASIKDYSAVAYFRQDN